MEGVAAPESRPRPKPQGRPQGRIVRVLPDVGAIRKEFDYVVPSRWADQVAVGTMVRIPLHGRRVAGWVTAVDVEAPEGVALVAITKVSGLGPAPEVLELCRWAAWRWSGKLAGFVGTASPPGVVRGLPPRRSARVVAQAPDPRSDSDRWIADAFDLPRATLRLPPTHDVLDVALAAARRGDALIICPSLAQAAGLAKRLRSAGHTVALHPDDWAVAAAGSTVVGARAAVFAPMPTPAAIVVIDEHDEALQNEGSPTWHARELALERGRRLGVPVVLTSPCPSLEAHKVTPVVAPSRSTERAGWPLVDVVDRRDDDMGRTGLYSEALVRALRRGGRVVCVLNRTGRSRLSACHKCGTLVTCERCEAAMTQASSGSLDCPRCLQSRPPVCGECGSSALRHLRVGVTKAREELETLLREPVAEVTGSTRARDLPTARVLIGTEAVLHQVASAELVAFLEFDQELTAPRYRAHEQAMALIVRAGRLVGPRRSGLDANRVIVQTRTPRHEVLVAALGADPEALAGHERDRRELLEMPPLVSIAVLGGPASPAFVGAMTASEHAAPADLQIDESGDGLWIVRSADRRGLLNLLATVERPPGRLRLQIDPMRLPVR